MKVTCTVACWLAFTVPSRQTLIGFFIENDCRRLTALLLHLQRAIQLRLRLLHLEQRAQTGFAALEVLPYGIVVASAAGEVVFANAVAHVWPEAAVV